MTKDNETPTRDIALDGALVARLWRVASNHVLDFLTVLRRTFLPLFFGLVFCAVVSIPQAGEFIKGLSKSCWSLQDCPTHVGYQSTPVQFLAFAVLTICFGLLIWYCARVLASYRAPPVQYLTRLGCAIERWLPRIAGYVVTASIAFELLGASTSVPLAGTRAASILTCTLLLAAPFYARTRTGDRIARRWFVLSLFVLMVAVGTVSLRPNQVGPLLLTVCALLAGITLFALLATGLPLRFANFGKLVGALVFSHIAVSRIWRTALTSGPAEQWTINSAVALLLPVLVFVFVVYREAFGWKSAFDGFVPSEGEDSERGLVQSLRILAPGLPPISTMLLWTSLILFLSCATIVSISPLTSVQVITAPGLLLVAFSASLLIASVLVFAMHGALRFGLGLMLIVSVVAAGVPDAPLAMARKDLQGERCSGPEEICLPVDAVARRLESWGQDRSPQVVNGPIIVVAAAGGGSRAALHTGSLLARIDASTCGLFGDHIFAISGVSGGSIGAAAYSAFRNDIAMTPAIREACQSQGSLDRDQRVAKMLERLLARDHLSASFGTLLFWDMPKSILPLEAVSSNSNSDRFSDRGLTLFASWAEAYRGALTEARETLPDLVRAPVGSYGSFLSLDAIPQQATPLLLLNSTSVEDGRRVVQGNSGFCPGDGFCTRSGSLLLGSAVDSARFSYVSPPSNSLVFARDHRSGVWFTTQRSLIDGGYFDNSGIVTLIDVVESLMARGVKQEQIFAVLISNDPLEGLSKSAVKDYAAAGAWAQLSAPLVGVVTARNGRVELAHRTLLRLLGEDHVIHWSLSDAVTDPLVPEEQKRRDQEAKLNEPSQLLPRLKLRDPDREPPLGWALSQTSAESIIARASTRALWFDDPKKTISRSEQLMRQALFARKSSETK